MKPKFLSSQRKYDGMNYHTMKGMLILFLAPLISTAQEAAPPRPSPVAIVSAHYKDTYVKIVYGQPHKKGRTVFGELVPFGKVWRTGANESTEITFTKDLTINGKEVKAGTYSVFTIPEKDQWTLILNTDLGMWGSYNYNEKTDTLRVQSPVQTLPDVLYEAFTITLEQQNDAMEMSLLWDHAKVVFTLHFTEPKP